MSRSYTSRPSVTYGRGRASQRQVTNTRTPGMQGQGARPRIGAVQNPGFEDAGEEVTQNESQEIGQRMTYEGAYTKITPNMKKRQEVNNMATRERESYETYIQQNTPKSFSYVGTAGGGQMTEAEARQKAIRESPSKTQRLLQNQQKKSFMKKKEDEELQLKKEIQRKKAIDNEQKKKDSDKAQQNRWDQQRRIQNEAFLNRIEAKNRQVAKGASHMPSPSEPQIPQRGTSESYDRLQPQGASSSSREVTYQPEADPCTPEEILTFDQREALTALSAVYPNYPQTTLLELLQQCDFSVNTAISLLTD